MKKQIEGEFWLPPITETDVQNTSGASAQLSNLNERIDRQTRVFDAILSSISDFAYAFDREGRFLFINRALLDLWGMKLQDAVGKTFFELPYPKELAATLQRQIMQVFETGSKVTDETLYINPEGHAGYYEYIFCPVFSADGSVDLVAGSTRDITGRKETEERLRESEDHYRNLFESIDEGFCIIEVLFDDNGKSIDYRFLNVNPSFEKQTGLKDIKGRTIRDAVPNHEEFWFETYGAVAKSGDAVRFESRAEALGRWYDVYAFRVGKPDESKVAVLFNDISERKRAEEEIRQLSERNREILESITEAFFALDRDWRFTYANPQAERLLDKAPGELLGQVIWDVYPGLAGSEFEAVYRRAGDERVASQVTSFYPDHKRWYEVNAYPARSGITAYFRNVTTRVETEAALRDSDRRKDEFLATLAHELRNPLAPIRSGLEILRGSSADKQKVEQTLEMIQRQTNQIVHLVDDLLDISRITKGKIRLRKEPVEIKKAVEMALETSRSKIAASQNELVLTLPPQPLFIDADITRISQILLNLLNNAAKFSPPGGKIWLTAEQEGNEAVISVRDTGRGIDPASLSRVFEMFGQIETPEKQDLGGLGIGLSVSKQLAEMHGGSIEAKSEGIGKGSEFIVRIPLATEQHQAATLHDDRFPAQSLAARAQKVLVVDDNRDAAEMLEMLLTINGHTVRTAFDALSGIETAREFEPEVCLLDIGLPGMNGFDLARRLREFLPDALLISVSGWGQPEDRRRSFEAGFDRHFVKPVEIDALLAVIQTTPTSSN